MDLGTEIINFDKDNPVEILQKETKGKGVLCIDSVGFEAVGHTTGSGNGITSGGMHDHSKVSDPIYEPANSIQVLEWMCQCARKFSTLSVPGAYSSSYDKFLFGQMWNKELSIRLGQCPVKKYNEQLLHLIEIGRIDATKIISHTMNLEAPNAYEIFDKKEQDVTK
jgi:S-(hydroxymethyl)glutathione dehydrogenase / alcohol dehydrogenase